MKKVLALLLVFSICIVLFAITLTACKKDDSLSPPPVVSGNDGVTENPDNNTPDNSDNADATLADGRPTGATERQALAEQYKLPYNPDIMDTWEPVTFTYFIISDNSAPAETNPILNIIEEITNVKIEFQFYDMDFEIALGVMVIAEDMPDMAYFGKNAKAAIESGHFLSLNELIENHAPNLRAFYDPWWEAMKYTDGKIYTAQLNGTVTGKQTVFSDDKVAFWLQKDVLDHFGRAPNDIDEYFDFIREYKELYPVIDDEQTIGFLVKTHGGINSAFSAPGYFLSGNANWGGAVNSDGNYFGAAVSPVERWTAEFNKNWWEKLNAEYRLGTIPRNSLNHSQTEYLSRISSGAVLGMFDDGQSFRTAHDKLIEDNRLERTYLPLALTYPGFEPNYLDAEPFIANSGIVLSSSISDPVRAIEFLDWIIDEDVQRFLSWGILDEHYSYDNNGRLTRTVQQRELQSDEVWVNNNTGRLLLEFMPKMSGTFPLDGNPASPDVSPEELYAALSGYDKELFGRLGIYTMADFWGEPKQRPVFYPFADVTDFDEKALDNPDEIPADTFAALEQQKEALAVYNRINDIINGRSIRNLITGRESAFETGWQNYLNSLERIDFEPLMEFYKINAE